MNNLKNYLFAIFCITLLALGIWMLILFNYDPYHTDVLTISAFFVSLVVWLSGIFTLVIFYLRVALGNKEVIYAYFTPSVRQAVLISIVIVGILVFQTLRVLAWWDIILLVISILLLELFFRTRTSS